VVARGPLAVDREWATGDHLSVTFDMPPERDLPGVFTDRRVRHEPLRRGPVVYCLEGVDHERPLHHYAIPRDGTIDADHRPDLLSGVTTLQGEARVPEVDRWDDDLYRRADATDRTDASFTAVPYYAWANREPSEMRVWMRACDCRH
jgi:DUF1680 family protein